MQENKTLVNKAMKAMLVAGFFAAMCPTSAFAADAQATNYAAAAQQNQIKGTVVDEFGEPMIGVTIKVKGAQVAGITDIDGNFALNTSEGVQVELSYVGYLTQTVKLTNGMRIQMQPDSQMMEEVVVIGFGTVKKRDVTGSVSSIKAEALVQAPTSDVATALQGRVSGLDVNDGALRIRGNRSINGSNNPLVIIDGVQGGSMGDINPQDIESIDVLKDASSTAIYGSQGANGVIIITTKKAEKGRMLISYDGSVTGAFRAAEPDYRSGENWYNAAKQAAISAGQWSSAADDRQLFSSNEAFAAYKANAWTDYEDLLERDITWSTRHTVTLAGGTDKTSARFSAGYASNGNKWKKGPGTDRFNLRANIDHDMYDWVSAGVNFQLTHNRAGNSPYAKAGTTGVELGSPYGVYDPETESYSIGSKLVERPLAADEYVNPLIDAEGNNLYQTQNYSTNVVANGYLDIHPIEGFSFRSQLNTHIQNSTVGQYLDGNQSVNLESTGKKNKADFTKNSSLYLEWNNIVNYKFTMLPKEHNLSLTALTTWSRGQSDYLSASSVGQTLASNLWWNLGSNDGEDGSLSHSSNYEQYQSFSYAGRVSYDYKSKYLFTASLRRDGASRLAEGNKWEWFPSAALAWRITDEAWMTNVKGSWLDDLKLRATYGVTGNSGIGVYGTKSGITFANWSFAFQDDAANRYILGTLDNNGSGYYVVANKDTKWEMSTTFDFGFDASLFHNRVNVVFDWYTTTTDDILLLRSLPTSAGMDGKYATYTNIGKTRNTGFEFTINSRNIVKKNFQWNSTLTFSANREKIIDLVDGADIVIGTEREKQTLMIGHPIKSFNTFKYDGIWKTSEADEAAAFGQKPGDVRIVVPGMEKVGPGVYQKADKNGNMVQYTKDNPYAISQSDDIQYIGSTSPNWFAGFNNDFTIGNFDVNIYFYARFGQWAENRMAGYTPSNGGNRVNMDYWVAGTNEDALLPGAYKGRNFFDYTGYQSIWFADNSFIKLKRITLGYTLPKSVLKVTGMTRARVYATVNDPLYWVKSDFQKGYDPEGNQRSITIGLNLNF